MKKFANLLKKEIKDLVNKQLIFTLLFMLALYNFIGQASKKEIQKIVGVQTISALDEDGSAGSRDLLKKLAAFNYKILDQAGKTKEQAIEAAKANDSRLLVVIPKGFGDSLAEFKPSPIEAYSFMRTFSIIGTRGQVVVDRVVADMNRVQSDEFLKEKLPEFDPKSLKSPIKSKEFVVVRDRVAEGSATDVAGMMAKQSLLIPIVLMMIVIYSSQMVIGAIAMEKQDKTLETLLTVPIKRTSIITAKMLAAGLVGLISAGVYMVAFKSFFGGMTGDLAKAGGEAGGAALMQKLGLTFNTTGYVVLGLAMFLAILVALALAMILGVLAEDLRSAQTMIMPLLFMVMIPYFISLFADVNSLSLPIKILILAIPFTHPFLVSQNLYLGNWSMIAFGLGYMFVIFVVLTIIAARIFSTDKILTMKLRLGKKKPAVA